MMEDTDVVATTSDLDLSDGNRDNGTTAEIVTASEIARALKVDAKTVRRWASKGYLTYFKTPCGYYRFLRSEMDEILNDVQRD